MGFIFKGFCIEQCVDILDSCEGYYCQGALDGEGERERERKVLQGTYVAKGVNQYNSDI